MRRALGLLVLAYGRKRARHSLEGDGFRVELLEQFEATGKWSGHKARIHKLTNVICI